MRLKDLLFWGLAGYGVYLAYKYLEDEGLLAQWLPDTFGPVPDHTLVTHPAAITPPLTPWTHVPAAGAPISQPVVWTADMFQPVPRPAPAPLPLVLAPPPSPVPSIVTPKPVTIAPDILTAPSWGHSPVPDAPLAPQPDVVSGPIWNGPYISGPWSMGFWTPWGPTENLDWAALTHLIMVGVEPQSSGALKNTFPDPQNVISQAHANGVRVLLNVWGAPGSDIYGAVNNNLAGLVKNIVDMVTSYGFDGVDIDWESGLDFGAMTTLLKALRAKLASGKILTADAVVTDSQFWGTVAPYIDRVNVMTYDMTESGNPYSWFNSPLYGDAGDPVWSIDLARKRFTAAGVPSGKLNIGIPFYGFVSPGVSGPRQPLGNAAPYQIRYSDLVSQYDLASAHWDSDSRTPWLAFPGGWISYDDPRSIAEKVVYVKGKGLGGWIIWALDQDLVNGKHVLMEAVKGAR